MARFAFLAVITLLLSGCGVARQAQITEARKQYETAKNNCEATHPILRGRMVARTTCSNEANVRFLRPNSPYPDLNDLTMATALYWATKFDKGEVPLEDATLKVSVALSEINAEGERRSNASRMVGAQEQAAFAQRLQASMQGMAAIQAASRPLPSSNVNCTTTGPYSMRSTNCN